MSWDGVEKTKLEMFCVKLSPLNESLLLSGPFLPRMEPKRLLDWPGVEREEREEVMVAREEVDDVDE